jgi:hypothetical protein
MTLISVDTRVCEVQKLDELTNHEPFQRRMFLAKVLGA